MNPGMKEQPFNHLAYLIRKIAEIEAIANQQEKRADRAEAELARLKESQSEEGQ